jgi:hypothetical protein
MDTFEDGYAAFWAVKSESDNPHEVGSQNWENWQAGYYSAFSESIPAFEE